MRTPESYRRTTGFANPKFKATQARLVIALIEGGYNCRQVALKVKLTHQRVSQIYFNATGVSVHDYRQRVSVESLEEALPYLLAQRRRVCPGCGVEFLMIKARRFHSPSCRIEYYNLHQTSRKSYIAKLKGRK